MLKLLSKTKKNKTTEHSAGKKLSTIIKPKTKSFCPLFIQSVSVKWDKDLLIYSLHVK